MLFSDEQRGCVVGRVDAESGGRNLGAVTVIPGLRVPDFGPGRLARSQLNLGDRSGGFARGRFTDRFAIGVRRQGDTGETLNNARGRS